MKIKQLEAKHPEHEGELWLDYEALYEGGKKFRRRVKRFLTQNPVEPPGSYQQRCEEAVYRSYLGTVIDYFAALLFSVPIIRKPVVHGTDREATAPEWSGVLDDDVDGRGTDLTEFLRLRLIDALVKRRSWWLLDLPDNYGTAPSRQDAETDGSSDVRIRAVQREEVIDWERDHRGRLLWAIVRSQECPRPTPGDERDTDVITWRVLDREKVDVYRAAIDKNGKPDPELVLSPERTIPHPLGVVPLVELDVSPGLWIANRLASPQLEHFRLSSATNWSIRRSSYAMPVFRVANPQEFNPRPMGAGYWLAIGKDEDASFMAPPSEHVREAREEIRAQKDEIFRIVTQMSLGVDNNAAAIGRSAESKLADAESIQVVLRAYGTLIRDTLKTTLRLVSLARGDDLDWTVEGLDKFDTIEPETLVELLKESIDIGIPSRTWKVEAKTRAAIGLLPGIDQATKKKIGEEIEAGIDEEEGREETLNALAKRAGERAQGGSGADRRSGGAAPAAPASANGQGAPVTEGSG